VVGYDVVEAVRNFFGTGHLLGEVNATVISLVPKVPHPESLTRFRERSYAVMSFIKLFQRSWLID